MAAYGYDALPALQQQAQAQRDALTGLVSDVGGQLETAQTAQDSQLAAVTDSILAPLAGAVDEQAQTLDGVANAVVAPLTGKASEQRVMLNTLPLGTSPETGAACVAGVTPLGLSHSDGTPIDPAERGGILSTTTNPDGTATVTYRDGTAEPGCLYDCPPGSGGNGGDTGGTDGGTGGTDGGTGGNISCPQWTAPNVPPDKGLVIHSGPFSAIDLKAAVYYTVWPDPASSGNPTMPAQPYAQMWMPGLPFPPAPENLGQFGPFPYSYFTWPLIDGADSPFAMCPGLYLAGGPQSGGDGGDTLVGDGGPPETLPADGGGDTLVGGGGPPDTLPAGGGEPPLASVQCCPMPDDPQTEPLAFAFFDGKWGWQERARRWARLPKASDSTGIDEFVAGRENVVNSAPPPQANPTAAEYYGGAVSLELYTPIVGP